MAHVGVWVFPVANSTCGSAPGNNSYAQCPPLTASIPVEAWMPKSRCVREKAIGIKAWMPKSRCGRSQTSGLTAESSPLPPSPAIRNRSRPCQQISVMAVVASSTAGTPLVVRASSLPGRPFVNGYGHSLAAANLDRAPVQRSLRLCVRPAPCVRSLSRLPLIIFSYRD